MIPLDTIRSMFQRGALYIEDDKYFVNFHIVQKEFPAYMEMLVLKSLNEFERVAYEEGYIMYIVLPDGLLRWKPTGKQL